MTPKSAKLWAILKQHVSFQDLTEVLGYTQTLIEFKTKEMRRGYEAPFLFKHLYLKMYN